jgi:hypothetical protein
LTVRLTPVPVKNSEKGDPVAQVPIRDVSVFHGATPPLHAHGDVAELLRLARVGVFLFIRL